MVVLGFVHLGLQRRYLGRWFGGGLVLFSAHLSILIFFSDLPLIDGVVVEQDNTMAIPTSRVKSGS